MTKRFWQVQALVAKMQTAAETAVGQRVGEAVPPDDKGWGRVGSVAMLGAIGKLKRKVDVFRSLHETSDERRAASLKFVSKALDPKASASMAELLHEVSVVMNLKMRMDEEHSVMLQQQVRMPLPHHSSPPPSSAALLLSATAHRKPHDRRNVSVPVPNTAGCPAHPGCRMYHVLYVYHRPPQRGVGLR